jgi:trimeric autotransporter adhesin
MTKTLHLASALLCGLWAQSCTVQARPELSLSPQGGALSVGQSVQLYATRRYAGADDENVTARLEWESTNNGALAVSNLPGSKGTVRALASAELVFVRVYDPESGVHAQVAFNVAAPSVRSILVSPGTAALSRSATRQFQAIATLGSGETTDVSDRVVWSTSNQGVVAVGDSASNKGLVTAVAKGTATITATDASTGVEGRAAVFVDAPELRALRLSPNPAVTRVGQTVQFTAAGVYGDGTERDLTPSVRWVSSLPLTATIDDRGLATGRAVGDATVTAVSSDGLRASALLAVSP